MLLNSLLYIYTAHSAVVGSRIGIDPSLVSTTQAKALEKLLSTKNMVLVSLPCNPIDEIWVSTGI